MNKKIMLIFISLIILSMVGFTVMKFFQKDSQKTTQTNPVLVETQPVRIKNIPYVVVAIGTLIAAEQISISAESNGYVKQVLFKGGQYIKRNDVLLTLDDIKAKADLLSSEADYLTARSKYERTLTLKKKGFIAKQDIALVYSDMQNKLAQKLEAEDTLNKKTIRAPFSGYLGKRSISVGDYITSGQKLIDLVNRKQLKIDYSVPEQYLNDLNIGQSVKITVDSMPNKQFNGEVGFISPTVDNQTHTVALQASIPNPKNLLAPGLFVTVKQSIKKAKSVLLVPEQSIIKTLQNTIVFKAVDGKAQSVVVNAGDLINGEIIILSGLSKKDVIVIEGQHQLHDGDFVKTDNYH